jgi:hypothetical protein
LLCSGYMKTSWVAIALASSLLARFAVADEPATASVPTSARSARAHARALTVAGATLLGLSAAATITATTVGTLGVVGGGSFCGLSDDRCSNSNGDHAAVAGIALGLVAGVTALVGIPLLVLGRQESKALKLEPQRFSFGAAPTYSAQQGAGVTASFGMRF